MSSPSLPSPDVPSFTKTKSGDEGQGEEEGPREVLGTNLLGTNLPNFLPNLGEQMDMEMASKIFLCTLNPPVLTLFLSSTF